MEVEQAIKILPGESGIRLDLVLSRRFPMISRIGWQERIRDGRVSLGGRPARPSSRVHDGQEVTFRYDRRPEPAVSMDVRILFEDTESIVISKPANLPVHPSGIYFQNTLLTWLRAEWPDHPPRPVHRLDRETSGCMLLARTSESASRLSRMFRTDRVRKEYLVIVEGEFPVSMDAAGYLGPGDSEVRKKVRFSLESFPGAVSARTEFFCERRLRGLSLLRARLHTGRTHQIRATLCSLGFPVTGDRLYGVDDSYYLDFIHDRETEEARHRLRMDRTALHSALVSFESCGQDVTVESPLPEDMEAVLQQDS